jgi:hypothetical protein
MNRTVIFLKFLTLLILSLTLSFLSGCATTRDVPGAGWEPWVGELTGGVDADLKMFFSRIEEGQDVYLIKGSIEGDINEISGGIGGGTMNAKIEGKVKDGIFNIRMWGHANVSEGEANITGKMIGTLSKTQAFGTWTIHARDDERPYEFSGEWDAKKNDSDQD